jgi:hypothetical protein
MDEHRQVGDLVEYHQANKPLASLAVAVILTLRFSHRSDVLGVGDGEPEGWPSMA